MSTNSLQLNWNSQILTEEDGHFKLLGCDKEPTKYTTRTRCQCSGWFFWSNQAAALKKLWSPVLKHTSGLKVHVGGGRRPKPNMLPRTEAGAASP